MGKTKLEWASTPVEIHTRVKLTEWLFAQWATVRRVHLRPVQHTRHAAEGHWLHKSNNNAQLLSRHVPEVMAAGRLGLLHRSNIVQADWAGQHVVLMIAVLVKGLVPALVLPSW